ncbi:MAG: S46 family peptidase, partial [Bryobacteraceae bacterium]
MNLRFSWSMFVWAFAACADEGMWLVNNFPRDAVKKQHGFAVTDAFLERIRSASVRLNSGGSGSFVSARGLLFTNHHVGSECIQKVSDAQHDYIARGFYAASEEQEKKCPALEINVLVQIDDATAKIKSAEKPGMTAAEIGKARREAMSRVEKECTTSTGNRCDVVTLYSGGRYDLYQYKKYTDVRLVMSPEFEVAAFGGDPDNFTYPRYCLDVAFFRAYENGRPLATPNHFRWSRAGVREGELVFVPGNPGTTGRLNTVAQLEYFRDHSYPLLHRRLASMIRALKAYGAVDAEHKRVAGDSLLSAENSYKAYTGFLGGLRDPQLMSRKRDEEQTLRARVEADPEQRKQYGAVWDQVAAAYRQVREYSWAYNLSTPMFSDLFNIARHVLRLPEEMAKPSDQRLREYNDAALESLEREIYSAAPIADSLE